MNSFLHAVVPLDVKTQLHDSNQSSNQDLTKCLVELKSPAKSQRAVSNQDMSQPFARLGLGAAET